ncbi:MAG TPA: sigma-70 family RNA polymerase sigma factor [Thermoanaerobaculia bacterium]
MNVITADTFDPTIADLAPIVPGEELHQELHQEIDELDFAQMYEENLGLLVAIAMRKFQVPEVDAEALAHEVFFSYLKRKDEIRDLHPWLIGAICHASRYFWRQNGRRTEQLDHSWAELRPDPASAGINDLLPAQLAAREILEALPPRYQEILRLRYYEGYSIREIADYLGVTAKYTQKLVARCLRRAEQMYNAAPARKKP